MKRAGHCGAMRIAALAVLMSLCLAVCGCAEQQESEIHDYLQARNGIVFVADVMQEVEEGLGIVSAFSGTGFFVGPQGEDPQYLVTNHHVIEQYLECGQGERVQIPIDEEKELVLTVKDSLRVYYDSNTYEEAYVVAYDEQDDVAILRLDKPTQERQPLTLRVPDDAMIGTTIYAMGFPGLADNEIISPTSNLGTGDISVTRGVVSRLITSSGSGSRWIQMDATIQHGHSGGPVVNEEGAVVGISTQSVYSDTESNYYAADISVAIDLLNRNNIPFTLYDPNPARTVWPVLWILAAVLVLAGVAAVAVIAIMRKKKPAPAPIPEPPSPAPAPNLPRPNPDDSGFRIQCVSGALNGKRLMIGKNAPLTLGRSAEHCNVVFPAATPGVSARHCSVWVSDGKVYLKDLGSTHGTFIAPGRKLSANQPIELKVGDSFYLGAPQERFVIAVKGGK